MPDTAEEGALREALAQQYRYVAALGLNVLASGNVSCRLGADAMLISAGGATPETIAPDTVVRTQSWKG